MVQLAKTGELTVFVRIGLYMLAGALVQGGWLPATMQTELVSPAVVEAVTGLVVAAAALVWYWVSKARSALRRQVTRLAIADIKAVGLPC